MNGKTYGAPVFQGGVSRAAFWVRSDLVEKYNFDWQNATNITDWEPFFDEVLAGEGGNVIPLDFQRSLLGTAVVAELLRLRSD